MIRRNTCLVFVLMGFEIGVITRPIGDEWDKFRIMIGILLFALLVFFIFVDADVTKRQLKEEARVD